MKIFSTKLGLWKLKVGHEDVNYHGSNVYENFNVNFADCGRIERNARLFRSYDQQKNIFWTSLLWLRTVVWGQRFQLAAVNSDHTWRNSKLQPLSKHNWNALNSGPLVKFYSNTFKIDWPILATRLFYFK